MIRGRFGESMALAEAALAVARAVDAPVAEARALNALGLDLASRSDFERRCRCFARAMRGPWRSPIRSPSS